MNDNQDPNTRDQRNSYYYSYGPYQSRDDAEPVEVEMVTPRSVVSYQTKSARKRSILSSKFYMFLLGAVVIAGLMFAADAANLFTGDQKLQALDGGAVETAAGWSANGANGMSNDGSTNSTIIRPGNVADIVDRTSNAVVKIETTVKQSSIFDNPLFNDPFFDRFFGDEFGGDEERSGGMGSGFIFDKEGYVLTNEHVIEGAEKIFVKLKGSDTKYPAKLLGTAYELDLAVLKIETKKEFPALKMGNSDAIRVGDWVVAIGNPYGFEHTVTVGVLSAKERPISIPDSKGTREYKNLLQTDASINPGNSGGPLLNLKGEVIGINTAVSAQAQGIGFAIPTTTVNTVLESLKANKKIVKPYLGVRLQDIDPSWVSKLGLSNAEGAMIVQIENASPADKAGLEPADVVLSVDGKKVNNASKLQEAIQARKPGDKVDLVIVRDGRKWSASVILGKMETGLTRTR